MAERCVVASEPTLRLDRWLRSELPGLSRRLIHALIADGSVRVDGRRAAKGSLVRPGARVTVPDGVGLSPNPTLSLRVLHEDPWLIAVDKPGGVPSHPLDLRERGSVVNFLLARYPETASLAGGLTHRLDTGTSGVLLAARSLDAWTRVRAAFHMRTIKKRYLALVAGHAPTEVTVDLPLGHDPADRRRMIAARPGLRVWPAVSTIRRLRTLGAVSLVAVDMQTGVTHQIRVHLASLGHPVLGDVLYGGPRAMLAPGRHALHAADLAVPSLGAYGPTAIHSALAADLARLAARS